MALSPVAYKAMPEGDTERLRGDRTDAQITDTEERARIAEMVREFCRRTGMTRQEVADLTGSDRRSVMYWLAGDKVPSTKAANRLWMHTMGLLYPTEPTVAIHE